MSSIAGDDQPAAKKQKTCDNADGPVEDDKTAREKLREAGFDPDDAHTARSEPEVEKPEYCGGWNDITPMTHFAFHGDLPMCRYLHHVRGSVTSSTDGITFWVPMYAALSRGHSDLAKWLYLHGAKNDVWRRSGPHNGFISQTVGTKTQHWFIERGVMQTSDGRTHEHHVRQVLLNAHQEDDFCYGNSIEMRQHLDRIKSFLPWCAQTLEDLDQPFELLHTFLLGTASLHREDLKDGRDGASEPYNRCLGSFRGILEHIGGYVLGDSKNFAKKREVLRQFYQVLSNIKM